MANAGDYNGDGKVNNKDKALAAKDLNNDGVINNDDETLRRDQFSMGAFEIDYKTAARIVAGDDSLEQLFTQAVNEGWSVPAFKAKLQSTDWYLNNGTEMARKAWINENRGGDAWNEQVRTAKLAVQNRAADLGSNLNPAQLDKLAHDYLYQGWSDGSRIQYMDQALSKTIDINKGQAQVWTQQLRKLANDNGVTYSDDFYQQATGAAVAGTGSINDYMAQIQEQAAGKYTLFADKIRSGVTVKSLASPYTRRMAEILELPEEGVSLDDPYISKALGGVDEKGNPVAMNLGDFETSLRKDPRWKDTKDGKTKIMGLATKMMQDWGFLK